MMRLRHSRAGITAFEVILAVVVVVLAIVVFVMWGRLKSVREKADEVDRKGRELSQYVANADDAMNPDVKDGTGLRTYLIGLNKKLHDHMGEKVASSSLDPKGQAHKIATDKHLDPPPPPVWD